MVSPAIFVLGALFAGPVRLALVEEGVHAFAEIPAHDSTSGSGPRLRRGFGCARSSACLVARSVNGAWPATSRASSSARRSGRGDPPRLRAASRCRRLPRLDQARGENDLLDPRRADQRREPAEIGHRQAIAERAGDRKAEFAVPVPMRRSQHAAIPAPPPVQAPLIAAIVGTRHCSSAVSTRSIRAS